MTVIIEHYPQFDKNFKKRIINNKKLLTAFKKRVSLFTEQPDHKLLKDHQLTGNKSGLRSFSVTGDIRIIYKIINDTHVIFYDIGSHNQVY